MPVTPLAFKPPPRVSWYPDQIYTVNWVIQLLNFLEGFAAYCGLWFASRALCSTPVSPSPLSSSCCQALGGAAGEAEGVPPGLAMGRELGVPPLFRKRLMKKIVWKYVLASQGDNWPNALLVAQCSIRAPSVLAPVGRQEDNSFKALKCWDPRPAQAKQLSFKVNEALSLGLKHVIYCHLYCSSRQAHQPSRVVIHVKQEAIHAMTILQLQDKEGGQ